MQFYVPLPWPLAIFGWFILIFARLIIAAGRLAWRYMLVPTINQAAYAVGFLKGYIKTKILLAIERRRERRNLEHRAEQAASDFERVEREAKEYSAGRVIEGEALRVNGVNDDE